MSKIKTLIIPDVHGREFWKAPVYDVLENHADANIIFLGDYHDPYGFEHIDKDESIKNFEEIIELKKKYSDRIHLLVGNHDASYITNISICSCRHDYANDAKIRNLFHDNHELFEMAHVDGNILYTHAGIRDEWIAEYSTHKYLWSFREDGERVDSFLNRTFQETFSDDSSFAFWVSMFSIGRIRGGYNYCGSSIWCDMTEHDSVVSFEHYVQIFGHTQQETFPVHFKHKDNEFYNLDCREAFYLDDKNDVRFYKDDKVIESTKELTNNWMW